MANRDISPPHPERSNSTSLPSRWKLLMAGAAQPLLSSTVLLLLFLEKDQQGHPPKNTDSYRSRSGFSITEDQWDHLVQLPHCAGPLPEVHPRGTENPPFLAAKGRLKSFRGEGLEEPPRAQLGRASQWFRPRLGPTGRQTAPPRASRARGAPLAPATAGDPLRNVPLRNRISPFPFWKQEGS